jgi:hypothetical protein
MDSGVPALIDNARGAIISGAITSGAMEALSVDRLLDLFHELEDLLKRIADTDDVFLRKKRTQVYLKLVAIQKELNLAR